MKPEFELDKYLAHAECKHLTEEEKNLLYDQALAYARECEYPIGRALAIALLHFNADVGRKNRVNQRFINWLYYY